MDENKTREHQHGSKRQSAAAAEFIPTPALPERLAIDPCAAMRDHALCVARLREHVYGGRPSSDLAGARCHATCAFGHWLDGAANTHPTLPAYLAVESAHADFHRAAAAVIALVDRGRRLDAWHAVETSGEVRQASRALVRAFHAFREDLRAGAWQAPPTPPLPSPAKARQACPGHENPLAGPLPGGSRTEPPDD